MNDKDLRLRVIDELDWEPSIDSAAIGVAVHGGVVTLSGHVATYMQKATAEQVAKRVKGVRGIAQEIEVRWGDERFADDDIAKRAVTALAYDVLLPDDAVQVKDSQGWLTLSGQVPWQYQRMAAEADVQKLRGVRGISNVIALKPQLSTGNIEKRIRDALARDAQIDAAAIKIKVVGDHVTLDGSVDCWRYHDLVERAVWAAPGVGSVEDHLRIT